MVNKLFDELNKHAALYVLLFSFLYSYLFITGIVAQKYVLPSLPEIHAEHGLLKNDAIYFHNVANELVENISENGFNLETISSDKNGARGNVTTAGVFYYFLGDDPALVMPINALLTAFSAVILFLIMKSVFAVQNNVFLR